MSTKTKAFSFAHLLSRAGFGAAEDKGGSDQNQDDERQQRDGESDDDYAKRMEELDRKDKDSDQADPDAEDDDVDPDAAEERDKEKAARGRERARCAAIFGSKAAGSRPDVAAHLAFNTSMSAREAIGMLGAFAAGGAPVASAPAQPHVGRQGTERGRERCRCPGQLACGRCGHDPLCRQEAPRRGLIQLQHHLKGKHDSRNLLDR
jgi:hypothetical protein